jgi:hypothetical protein
MKTVHGYAAVRDGEIVAYSFLTGVYATFTNEHWAKVHCPKDAEVVECTITIKHAQA